MTSFQNNLSHPPLKTTTPDLRSRPQQVFRGGQRLSYGIFSRHIASIFHFLTVKKEDIIQVDLS